MTILRITLTIYHVMVVADVIESIRSFTLHEYFSSIWNIIDWSHFCVMWLGWIAWLRQIVLTNSLPMNSRYPILVSPGSTTEARAFLTNASDEYAFLTFMESIDQLMQNLSMYNTMTALGGSKFRFTSSVFHCLAKSKFVYLSFIHLLY